MGKVVDKVSHVQHTQMDTRGDQYRDSDTHKDTRRHEDRHTGTFNRDTQRHTEWDSNPGPSESKAQPLSAPLSKALEMKGHASCALKSFPGLRYSK